MKNILLSIAALVIVLLTSDCASAQTVPVTEVFNVGSVQINMEWTSTAGNAYYSKGLLDNCITIKNGVVYVNPNCDRPVVITVDSNDGKLATYYIKPGADKIVLASTKKKAQINVNF